VKNVVMTIEPEKIAKLRVKHLEMLQAVVARMASQGATTKNFCITLTTASCGLALTLQKPLVALLGIMPIAICSLLDSQFLKLGRRFRGLFDRVRLGIGARFPALRLTAQPPMHRIGRRFAIGRLSPFISPCSSR
jgi:hypothetical protein